MVGGAASLVASACSGSEEDAASESTVAPFDPALQQLGVEFPDGFRAPSIFVAGDMIRAPFSPVASDGFPVQFGEPDTIGMTVTLDRVEVFSGDVPGRRAGVSSPFYPLQFVPEVPGTYEVLSDWSDTPRQILVNERAQVSIPLVGDPLPEFDTPTFEDGRGVDPICTRLPEPCPFHDQTLTESLATGNTTALLLATPQFCQTTICGPVVELMVEAAPDYPTMSVVHGEIWATPFEEPQAPAPAAPLAGIINAYQMHFEPSLYLADEQGVIVEALHFAFDRDELRTALEAHS